MADSRFQSFLDQIGEVQKQGKPIDKLVQQTIAFLEAQPPTFDDGKRNQYLVQMKLLLVHNTVFGAMITGDSQKMQQGMASVMDALSSMKEEEAAHQKARREQFASVMVKLSAEQAKQDAEHKEQRAAAGLSEEAGTGQAEPEVLIHGTLDAKVTQQDTLLRNRRKEQEEFWATLKPGQTRLGGLPDLPPGQVWPVHQGKKLPFLAQLNLSEFPKAVHKLLPADGHLFFFGLQSNDEEHWPPPVVVFLYRGSADKLVRAKQPSGDDIWPDWQGVSVYDLLPGTTTPKGRSATKRSNRFGEILASLFGEVSGEFGTAGEFADERMLEGDDWINLLTLQSEGNMMWSDSGELYFLIRRSDLEKLDFSKVFSVCCSG